MPRITASTVEEHREAQRRALLDAARSIVIEGGLEALNFRELGERTGLARPTVYEYFRSKAELTIALIDAEFPAWEAVISAALGEARGRSSAVEAFVRSQISLAVSGKHDLAFAIMSGPLDADAKVRVATRHAAILTALEPHLDLGPCTEMALRFLGGLVGEAIGLIRSGRSPQETADVAAAFAAGGIEAIAALQASGVQAE